MTHYTNKISWHTDSNTRQLSHKHYLTFTPIINHFKSSNHASSYFPCWIVYWWSNRFVWLFRNTFRYNGIFKRPAYFFVSTPIHCTEWFKYTFSLQLRWLYRSCFQFLIYQLSHTKQYALFYTQCLHPRRWWLKWSLQAHLCFRFGILWTLNFWQTRESYFWIQWSQPRLEWIRAIRQFILLSIYAAKLPNQV